MDEKTAGTKNNIEFTQMIKSTFDYTNYYGFVIEKKRPVGYLLIDNVFYFLFDVFIFAMTLSNESTISIWRSFLITFVKCVWLHLF